ncbi:hypothetical protein BCR44DRAFT_99023, partial [Catenaria anguillulae PL171]
ALVYGGAGALGRAIVTHFQSKLPGWSVVSVDRAVNSDASLNITAPPGASWTDTRQLIASSLPKDTKHLDAIICVAGGWQGGSASSPDFLSSVETSLTQSVQTSAIAAALAAQYLRPHGGLLVLTGSHAALAPTPGMIGYGLAKAAVHHLVQSLGAPNSGMPEGAKAVAILPATLDTPANRAGMPKADFSSWTPVEEVAGKIGKWASGDEDIQSGSLVSLVT